MKKLLLFFIILFCTSTQAQNWCPPGATWYYRDYNTDPDQWKDGTLQLYYTTTVNINNIICKEIKGTFYGAVSFIYQMNAVIPDYVTYRTYESNNVVYIFNIFTQAFDTIANFNAHIGDSWFYALNTPQCSDFHVPRSKVTVYDTGHVVINNMTLKKLVISPPTATAQSVLIERIGGMPGYLFMKQDCNQDGETMGNFSCYTDFNFPTYKQTGVTQCNLNTVSIAENTLADLNIQLYPNPSNGDFKIESAQPFDIKVFNGLGASVYQAASGTSGTMEIHLTDQAAGIYYLKASNDHGTGYIKLIKQ